MIYNIKQDSNGTSYTLSSGTPSEINLTVSALTQPSGTIRWFLHFFKLSDYIIDVGFYIEWTNPALVATQIVFDFPSELLTDLVPTANPPINENTVISPVRQCAFFTNQTDPIIGTSWIRLNNGNIQFVLKTTTSLTMIKAQAEFRYLKETNIVTI